MMAFFGYKDDAGECYWTSYSSSTYDYDYSPQALLTYSLYEFEEPKLVEHIPYTYSDTSTTEQVQNYSRYSYSEPRLIQYEPPPCASGLFSSETNYLISYTTLEFAEPEFEEYDPTPYGGGYDLIQTYGKPLPPSDETCYPRSAPKPNALPPDGFSYVSISSAYEGNDACAMKPNNDKGSKPADNKEQELHSDTGDKVTSGYDNGEAGDLNKSIEVKSGYVGEHPAYDYNNGFENGRVGGYKQVPYIPYGSGLEAMDLCESLFGYWPCLAKIDPLRYVNREAHEEEGQHDPWKSTAEYLFGSPFVYGEQKKEGNWYYSYENGSHYQHYPSIDTSEHGDS